MTTVEEQEKRNELVWKVFLWAMAILIGILVYEVRRQAEGIETNDRRLTTIEASRCNANDCNNIRLTLSNIQAEVAGLPKEVPPKWFLDKVNALERRLDLFEARMWSIPEDGSKLSKRALDK